MCRGHSSRGLRADAPAGLGLAEGHPRADTRGMRALGATLVAALTGTAVFAVIQQNRHLEDEPFLHTLIAFSIAAFALALVSCLVLRVSVRASLASGVAASLLVPLLFAGYMIVRVIAICYVGGQTCWT